MSEIQIRPRVRAAIIQALSAGVVPGQGLQYIQVGRHPEIKAMINAIDTVADGGSTFKLIVGDYGAGKTFFLHLVRKICFEKKLVTLHADFSPERRLVASSGEARNFYSELIANMSTRSRPDGNALSGVIEAFITDANTQAEKSGEATMKVIETRLEKLNDLVSGYDFSKVVLAYCQGHQEANDELKQNAIRWLRGEFTTKIEARKHLDVRTIIDDSMVYDALKLMKTFVRLAGYSGLLIVMDEAVNLFKIVNSQSRTSNYEMVLRMLNDTLQSGSGAEGLAILIGVTPEAVFDPRRGICSYDALASRLAPNKYAERSGLVDMNQPSIHLQCLTPEELFLLLGNIRSVFASSATSCNLIDDDGLKAFMEHCNKAVGAAYFKTPRETVRAFVNLQSMLEQYPEKTWEEFIGDIAISEDVDESKGGADEDSLENFKL